MTKIRDDINEHGTKITVFLCSYCGSEYSVCPAVPDNKLDRWDGACTAPDCESYDPARDVDAMLFFGVCKLVPKDDLGDDMEPDSVDVAGG